VMSDHGDSLGDLLRFGHAYTLFPEVLRVPLIVHVPPPIRQAMAVDTTRAVFSIDVTPTLYALLGYTPIPQGPQFGVALFQLAPASGKRADRRQLIVSSYGATYGVVSDDGSSLYIADATERRDYAYDIGQAPLGVRIGVRPEVRQDARAFIRQQVDALAARYGFAAGHGR